MTTHIVLSKGTITIDASTLGLEFQSKEQCNKTIAHMETGGFDKNSFEIVDKAECIDMIKKGHIQNYTFTEKAWGDFLQSLKGE